MFELIAFAPALPLGEAGKYVVAAYLAFLAVILIYVAIMGAKLARIERELEVLTELADQGKNSRAKAK